MKNLFLKVISMVLVFAMIVPMAITAFAMEYPDEGYWANEAINGAKAVGLLQGKDSTGYMDSEANLTRAEMATIMVRAFGASKSADISNFKDIPQSAWYYDAFAKAVQMRVFEGDGTGYMRPNDNITREEVFAVVARALVLNSSDHSILSRFNDSSNISEWALGYMSIMTQKSYVNGDETGNVNPRAYITRAEFAQVMYNIFKINYVKTGFVLDKTFNTSLMINGENVNLTNVIINGDLIIGDGANESKITLTNVTIKGRLVVRGTKTIKLNDTTVGEMVVVNNYNNIVHFDNFKSEKVFKGIIENTKATFKTIGGGGGVTTPPVTGADEVTVNFYNKEGDTDSIKTVTKQKQQGVEIKLSSSDFPAELNAPDDADFTKDSSISSIYTTPYTHTVNFGWWYKNGSGEWVEFTTDTVVTQNLDVYRKSKKFEVQADLMNNQTLLLRAFYTPETRFADTVKDILWGSKTNVLNAVEVSGYWDKLRENKRVQKILDINDNIMMINTMIRFTQIIGDSKEEITRFILGADAKAFIKQQINNNPTSAKQMIVETINNALNGTPQQKAEIIDTIKGAMATQEQFDAVMAKVPADIINDKIEAAINQEIDDLVKMNKGSKDYKDKINGIVDVIMGSPAQSTTFKSIVQGIVDDAETNGTLKELVGDEYDNIIDTQVNNVIGTITSDQLSYMIGIIINDQKDNPDKEITFKDMVNSTVNADLFDKVYVEYEGKQVTKDDYLLIETRQPEKIPEIKAKVYDIIKNDENERKNIIQEMQPTLMGVHQDTIKTWAKDIAKNSDADGLKELLGDTIYTNIVTEAKNDFMSKLDNTNDRHKIVPEVADKILTDSTQKQKIVNMILNIVNSSNNTEKDKMFKAICGQTYKDLVTDKLIEILDTPSVDRDDVVDQIVEYIMGDDNLKDDLINSRIDQMTSAEIESMVGSVIGDDLVNQLINEDQFEITSSNIFVAEGIEKILNDDYTYDKFIKPQVEKNKRLKRLYEIYAEDKVKELYEYSIDDLLIKIANAKTIAQNGGTGKIDCGLTVIVNPIEDLYAPIYNALKKTISSVDSSNKWYYWYDQNPYLKELIELLEPVSLLNGSAAAKPVLGTANSKVNLISGYKIKSLDDYYELIKKIAVLADDAVVWYHNNLTKQQLEDLTDDYQELVLKYVNIIADILEAYVDNGTLPNEKLSPVEKAIKDRYPDLVNKVVAWYKDSPINKDYAADDYQKVQDMVYKVLMQVNFTTDEFFDKVLSSKYTDKVNEYGEKVDVKYQKIDEDTYKVSVKDYSVTILRKLVRFLEN